MNGDSIANIMASIVTVALVTTVLTRGSAAAQVIRAFGDAFSGSLRAATNG